MAYTGKTNWQNNEIVEASDMNRIEQGISDVDVGLGNVQAEVTMHKADGTQHAKTAKFVVGTSTSGWTEKDCDYLCDGTADQEEINNAIAALPTSGGEIVVLDGTYNFTGGITVNKDNVSIKGNGNGTILKRMWDSSSGEGVITLTSVQGCRIESLQIDGNNTTFTSNYNYGIHLDSSSNNIITGNTSNNNSNNGIRLYSCSNNTITGNTCYNNNNGINIATSNNNMITGNTCNNNGNGIYLTISSNNTITGNACYNNNNGINLAVSNNNNTITANTCIRGTGTPGDYTAEQYTIILSGAGNNYNLITSNNCMGKAVVISGGTGNTIFNNKWDASDDIQNIEEQINTLDTEFAAHKAENLTDAHFPAKNLSLYRHELYPEQQPTLVLTYDDGYLEDFTNMLPVHQAHGVPGVSYVSSGAMGQIEDRVLGTRQFMTLNQLKILEANGWEIGCHTKSHKPLGGRKPLLPITANDKKIYLERPYEYFYRLTDTVELQIKEGEVEETIIAFNYGEDATGTYIELQQPIQNSYTIEATIRLSWAEHERELLGNLFTLRQLGLDVKNHAYPFGDNDSITRVLAAKYYSSASGIKPGIHQGIAALEQEPLRTFEMWRVIIDGKDNQFIENQLDEVVQKKGLLMFLGHPNKDADLPDRVDYAITQAKAKGIKIVTHREALEMFGNIIEVGDWIGEEENRYNRRPGYFVMTKRGAIYCPWLELGGVFDNQAVTTNNNALLINTQNILFQSEKKSIFHIIKGRDDIVMGHNRWGKGLVVTTPDGNKKFRIRVDNNGNIVTDDVTSEYPVEAYRTTWDGD